VRPLASALTPNAVKSHVFRRDPAFNQGVALARELWGGCGSLHERLWNLALMLVRPDAIAAGRMRQVLPLLREHGLIPVAVRKVWLDHGQAREMWRYQANVATAGRLLLMDEIMTVGPSLAIALRDATHRVVSPATVHLTYLKGPTLALKRRPRHVRSVAGPGLANILSYIHASDEPADLLREAAILFPPAERVGFFLEAQASEDRTSEVLRAVSRLESRQPAGLLTPAEDCDPAEPNEPLRLCWADIVRRAKACRSFVSGETYDPRLATIPDGKDTSYPLDWSLVFSDYGRPP